MYRGAAEHRQIIAATMRRLSASTFPSFSNVAVSVDGVGRRTVDLDSRDIGAGRSAAICHPASLRRVGRLRKNCDHISATAGDGRGEREASVRADRQVVAAIVLQHQAGAGETRDRASDGVGNRGTPAILCTAASATYD